MITTPGVAPTTRGQADDGYGQRMSAFTVDRRRHDYRPTAPLARGLRTTDIACPPCPGAPLDPEPPLFWEYAHPAGRRERQIVGNRPTLGALEP